MHSFWERIIQPQLFALLSVRYGGTEHVSRAKRPTDAIANGQFILVRRGSLRRDGRSRARSRPRRRRHGDGAGVGARRAAHRHRAWDATSFRRTCTGCREAVSGWRKNIYAGGRHAALGGALGARCFRRSAANAAFGARPAVRSPALRRRDPVQRVAPLVGDRVRGERGVLGGDVPWFGQPSGTRCSIRSALSYC